MEENLKNGVVIMPKAIVDLVEKAEKTSADCKAIYDYLVAYKEAKKTFEMRKGDKVAFITKVEYLSDEVKTELFSVKEDEFEEAPSVESIAEELADKQDKLTAGDGITISNADVISVDGDLVPVVGGSDKDKYLHTNASTGDLEWAEVSGGKTYVRHTIGFNADSSSYPANTLEFLIDTANVLTQSEFKQKIKNGEAMLLNWTDMKSMGGTGSIKFYFCSDLEGGEKTISYKGLSYASGDVSEINVTVVFDTSTTYLYFNDNPHIN